MKAIKHFSAAILTIAALSSPFAYAVDIRFEGEVKASTCEVDTNTVEQTVSLGEIPRYRLSVPNSGGDWSEFELKVSSCPDHLTKVTARFEGFPTGTGDSLYQIYPIGGHATNVAVQLVEDANKSNILKAGSTLTTLIDQNNHTGTFGLAARMYTEQGSATSGDVQTAVEVYFSYE